MLSIADCKAVTWSLTSTPGSTFASIVMTRRWSTRVIVPLRGDGWKVTKFEIGTSPAEVGTRRACSSSSVRWSEGNRTLISTDPSASSGR